MSSKPRRCAAAPQRGFTLVELMVTVSIVAILGLLAAPSLQSLIGKIRMNGLSTQFTGHLLRARTEAVNRNSCTVMCVSANTTDAIVSTDGINLTSGPTCSNVTGNWQAASPGGWIVFFKDDCSNTTSAADSMPARPQDYIALQTSSDSAYRIDPAGSFQVNKLFFRPTGRPERTTDTSNAGQTMNGNATFSVMRNNTSDPITLQYGQRICVDMLGRTRTISISQNC